MPDEGLPGAPERAERIVAHVDADCFYAACERLREPALEGEPVVVGMGYEDGADHGAVATASYEAREHGIESAQAISTALERLPRAGEADPGEPAAHYRPVDMEFYESVGSEVEAILDAHADTLRRVSVDEAYLDLTDRTGWSGVAGYARELKEHIEREAGITASVGVAPTMSGAKVASDRDKPDGQVVVGPDELREFLAPLSVEEIHGVGPVRGRRLRERGIETAGDLAAASPAQLAAEFGERGRELRRRARGEDDREVTPRGRPKSLSRESAFPEAVADPERTRERVATLARAVADRATGEGALYRTIGIKAVEPPYEVRTRERSLPGPVDRPALVEEVALELFAEFADDPVRKVGVRVSNLSFPAGEQSGLDRWEGTGGDEAGRPQGTGEDDAGRWDGDDAADSARLGQTRLSDF